MGKYGFNILTKKGEKQFSDSYLSIAYRSHNKLDNSSVESIVASFHTTGGGALGVHLGAGAWNNSWRFNFNNMDSVSPRAPGNYGLILRDAGGRVIVDSRCFYLDILTIKYYTWNNVPGLISLPRQGAKVGVISPLVYAMNSVVDYGYKIMDNKLFAIIPWCDNDNIHMQKFSNKGGDPINGDVAIPFYFVNLTAIIRHFGIAL